MSSPAEKTDNPSEEQQVRSSSRERSLTTKGQELHEQEARRNEKAFNKAYDTWKHSAKEVRVKMKVFCSAEDLDKIQLTIKSKQAIVHQNYEPIRRNHTTTPDIVKRMDACDTLTAEICDLVSKRLENIDEAFNDQLEKERDPGLRIPLNPQAVPFQPHSSPFEVSVIQEEVSLAQAIASSLTLSRLPVPEPTTFTGDPLKFIDLKISFMALIDQKPLPASEKMLYLKSYLAGEARKAVEGFFYRNSEKAYEGAWAVLQDRYGSPFMVQRAFREKLMKWPKIASNDPIALREFADFLQGCVEAIPHVKGLSILNDCEENHKLLKKLPEWMMRHWSRIVVEELDRSGEYPSFVHFTEFMQTEARIACNPIASPLLMNMKTTDERLPKRTKALNTSALMKNSTTGTLENSKPKPPCLVYKDETHGVVKCPTFAAKTMDVKKAFIHENHLCFGCLRKGHTTKDCKRRHTCSTCGRRHPTCLHIERNRNPVESTSKDPIATGDHASKEIHKVMTHALTQHVSATSSIVPVLVSSTTEPKKEILTYALFDTQSDSTFILEDLVAQLNVNTQSVQLKLSTMTAVNTVIASKIVCGLQVRGLNSETYAQLQQTYTRDFIPVEKSHIPTKGTALQWPHLKHLVNKLHPLQDCEVGLLIGYDCPSALAPLEVITGDENEPFAQRTMLGWSIIGSANPHLDRQGDESFVHRVAVKEMPVATDVLKVLESDFNERSYEDRYVSQDDVCFIQLLNDNIKQKKDGHFEIPLPFKGSGPPVLPNNKKLATIRLHHLKKKLKANKQYFDHYTTFMEEIIRRGDAEPAPPFSEGETVWYIPHHGVYNPKKPGKLRVVFDCSAKFRGISLNDTLLTGPDLINSLVGVLCRFRREAVAVICDIKRMFHQFSVSPEDRNYLRFLWWEGGLLETEPKEYRMTVHLFGDASSPGCANFCLKYLAQQHKVDYSTASAFVEKDFYVDDGLTSVPTVKEAQELIVEAQKLCKDAGLHLHKFNSNQAEVLSCVASSERAVTTDPLNLSLNATSEGHVLGIQWSSENDTFSFNIDAKDHPPTRRGLLSVVASLYDPLGFVAPFTLSGKRILQELCRRGIGWDDPIPENLHSRWEEWKNGLLRLKEVTIPRCYHPQNFGKIVRVELHHFSDASNVGYGSCSYLRYKNDKDEVHCSFVMAKARVAPTKITSIPRLELSAAVTAARMSVMLRAELEMKIEQEFFWTDSQVVLAYINNEARRFHVFVANRVQLIREITDPNQWNYVDTAQNPADHASRGLHATDISSASWLSGPKFLWEQEVLPMPRPSTELLACDPEVKSIQVLATQVSDQNSALSRLSRFSTWTTLVKVVARIKRLGSKRKHHGEIVTVEERRRAAEVVIQLVQQQAFSHELKALQSSFHGDVIPSSSPLFHLDPILDDKLLRVGGRLKGSTLSQELKHPIILPKDSHITKLILSHYHAQTCHQGRSQTLMELRANGFWAIGATSHAGGVWERQIRTIRNVLNVTIAQCSGRLDDASLRTLFYEAMAIVNSRPLNVDGINDPMAPEPLTPNHLILMKSKVALPPPGKFVKEDMQKWHVPRRNLKVNDIVILKEDTLPRNQWQLGRVVETREGTDGLVRRVKVQVGERKLTQKQNYCSKPSIIERPIQKLVLLLEDE
ncbi:hypothetical protein QQF64_014639 [Cirrhinus molitorella]|uniref:CCHC-type domain-containing protein n=1 Tax=Cirrhinus molitorella TaxID=172907 RepID=A0ABR3NSW2_9TELE